MSPFNQYILKIYINLLHFIVKFNVNSTCYMFHGQPIEPDSLKRYKKAKKINQNWNHQQGTFFLCVTLNNFGIIHCN